MTLMALMKAPETYSLGIAGAPVTDWRLYDTHYTERYMGTPQENSSGYKEGNVLEFTKSLKGRLLLVHGMADDNVIFAHSTQLMRKLQDQGSVFQLMTYPGERET